MKKVFICLIIFTIAFSVVYLKTANLNVPPHQTIKVEKFKPIQ